MSDIILSATGVSKSYQRSVVSSLLLQEQLLKWRRQRRKITIHALHPVSVSVKRGEWLGIYGHNGSGKTTLLRILAGLLQSDSGSVARHGSLSCFFELGIGFHPERRAEENIYLHGLLQGYSRKEINAITADIINFAGIESHLDLPIKCYSTGMQMRLAYAAAAQVDRDIYLFDEVLAVGDVAFQHHCLKHMITMKEKGKTVVLVAHGIVMLEAFCERIITMEHGRIDNEVRIEPSKQSQKMKGVMDYMEVEMAKQPAMQA